PPQRRRLEDAFLPIPDGHPFALQYEPLAELRRGNAVGIAVPKLPHAREERGAQRVIEIERSWHEAGFGIHSRKQPPAERPCKAGRNDCASRHQYRTSPPRQARARM